MRFVPASCIREGMVVAKSIYDSNGLLMLAKGVKINSAYIKSISRLHYNGVYIDDDLSQDIEIINVISEDLKNSTIRSIKDVFIYTKKNPKQFSEKLKISKELIENIVDEILENNHLMVNIIDLKSFDDYTFYHSMNVAILSILTGIALKLHKQDLYQLGIGALLHDIGKIFINKDILNKNGKLTEEEYEEIKQHSYMGYKYLQKEYDLSVKSYMAILEHHERYDGTGYPNNKSKDEISLFGKIIAISDVYDALTSDRPYRKGMLPSEAMEYIMGGSETLFDPELVKIFTKVVAPYPIGTCVKLSNGCVSIVIENYTNFCLRPKIKIFKDKTGFIESYILDLANDSSISNITITDIAKI